MQSLSLFHIIILIGVAQGFFLSYFFLVAKRDGSASNHWLGGLLFILSLSSLEVFLNDTGLIARVIAVYQFSEPFGFLISPFIYFYFRTRIDGSLGKNVWIHFLPFAIYSFNFIFFALQSDAFKLDDWTGNFNPDAARDLPTTTMPADPLGLRRFCDALMLAQLAAYQLLVWKRLSDAFKEKSLSFWSRRGDETLAWLRFLALQLTATAAIFMAAKLVLWREQGEYVVASFISVIIYSVSFSLVKSSTFFASAKPERRGLTGDDAPWKLRNRPTQKNTSSRRSANRQRTTLRAV